jgi:hypothetical protein
MRRCHIRSFGGSGDPVTSAATRDLVMMHPGGVAHAMMRMRLRGGSDTEGSHKSEGGGDAKGLHRQISC